MLEQGPYKEQLMFIE